MEHWIIIIFSSALISAIISGVTSYIIEKRKFSQEYWKISIEKRLEVYEQLEQVLIFFQTSSLINGKPCHLSFLHQKYFSELQTKLSMLTWKRSWISTEIYNQLIKLNRLLFECNSAITIEEINDFGVRHYQEIALAIDEILKLISNDYLKMSDVKGFFKNKIKEQNSK